MFINYAKKKWHYNPSVLEAFNSVEHKAPVFLLLCVSKFNFLYFLYNNNTKKNFHTKIIESTQIDSKNLSDEEFYEWFRGLTDGEGSFSISQVNKSFAFKFVIFMHKDEVNMLNYIAQRLKIGNVNIWGNFAGFSVTSQKELLVILQIFDNYPLNTSKHLNYLAFKEAYNLYIDSRLHAENYSDEFINKILEIKNSMNKNRINYNLPSNHKIYITPYWLLGFVEAEGYFSISNLKLIFGIGQTASELAVLEAIKDFLLKLPGKYSISRKDTNVISVSVNKKAKNINSKPMAKLEIVKTDYITNVIVPFFENLIWLSKKKLDFEDWNLVLKIKNDEKHFTDEGKELILLISKRINRNRLSTNLSKIPENNEKSVQKRIENLLASPSNYEIKPNGKILIKSTGTYLKGRGNIAVNVFNVDGKLIYEFNSIKECALFFKVSDRTINRRLENGSIVKYENQELIFKRVINLN